MVWEGGLGRSRGRNWPGALGRERFETLQGLFSRGTGTGTWSPTCTGGGGVRVRDRGTAAGESEVRWWRDFQRQWAPPWRRGWGWMWV